MIVTHNNVNYPIEIAEAKGLPTFTCPDCGQIHVGTGRPFDESELEKTSEEIYNDPNRKTPLEVVEPVYMFRQALIERGLL